MTGGSLREPLLTVAWPGADLGPVGLEGAVRLGMRQELDAIADPEKREERVRQATAAAQEKPRRSTPLRSSRSTMSFDPADTRAPIGPT